MASEIHEIYAFGPQLNTFMAVGIWLKVTVDLQRPNFAKFVFFAPDIAKIVI